MATKVIFRKFVDGDIIAVFPEIPHDCHGNVLSYMHVGQHAGTPYPEILTETFPVMIPAEYKPLFRELEAIGYKDLVIDTSDCPCQYLKNNNEVVLKESNTIDIHMQKFLGDYRIKVFALVEDYTAQSSITIEFCPFCGRKLS